MGVLAILQSALILWLSIYGLNAFILAWLHQRHRRTVISLPVAGPDALPRVTVQLPVYNERYVVERAIDAVAAFDYPSDRLQIQVLDDSDDETTELALARVEHHRAGGVDITLVRRPNRDGYKAGALAWAWPQATGEYIAIFDADFCPSPDFLLRTIPYFVERPRLGMVQTRWSYVNSDYSLLTRVQALALDGHFGVEQVARNRSGLLMSFNGSGGIWRKACVDAAGGWQTDTICEDLDLSYRAQLAGWECLYVPDVCVPAELPPQMAAFKRQQARWAQGSAQVLRKLTGGILRSGVLRWPQKFMALIHISGYLAHPLMVALLLITLPALIAPDPATVTLGGLSLLGLGPPVVYTISQKYLYADWKRRMVVFPLLMMVGIGIAWCNAKAVWRGLTRWGGEFERTPKFRIEDTGDRWLDSSYLLDVDISSIGELLLAGYALGLAIIGVLTDQNGVAPFMLVYSAGFSVVAGLDVAQVAAAWWRKRRSRIPASPQA